MGMGVATYRDALRVREFRYLFGAQTLSVLGDQLVAVAVAILIYDRTASGLLAAIGYAAGWLPGLLGGPLLATYADNRPRRTVMILCDLARAVLLMAIVVPGLPIPAAMLLLYAADLVTSPFAAARAALMPEVLGGEVYIAANGLGNLTFQVCRIGGIAAGGAIGTWLGPTPALLADAATFLVSAALIRVGVRHRVAARNNPAAGWQRDVRDGLAYVFSDRRLRGCLLLVWLGSAFAFAPQAVAYPYAEELGAGPAALSLLLAVQAAGITIGGLVLTRLVGAKWRIQLLVPLAMLSTAALVPALAEPGMPVVAALFFIVGVGASFAVPLNAMFAGWVAGPLRGRAMGVAISGLNGAQGLGFVLAGGLVQAGLRPSMVTGLCGLAGMAVVTFIGLSWRTVLLARSPI
jgi:MFS family permease